MNALLEMHRVDEKSELAKSHCDDRIEEQVYADLARTKRSALRPIKCESQHGMLKLIGEVDCYYLKQLVQEHARHVDGVTHIGNGIHVNDAAHPSKKATR